MGTLLTILYEHLLVLVIYSSNACREDRKETFAPVYIIWCHEISNHVESVARPGNLPSFPLRRASTSPTGTIWTQISQTKGKGEEKG